MILDTVELFLEKYGLLKPKNNIIVAFSGGYDSMCLLDILKSVSCKYDLNLIAVHLNHNWRGTESDIEEINCKNFCKDICFYSEKLPAGIPHTETAAREERYKFFKRCAEKFGSEVILTAHNANDNAETVFYRMIKGTGITGLSGIQEHRDIYYRPFLSIYRDEIEDYCRQKGLQPNTDSSNYDTGYARNKIRYEIFPKLKEFTPDIEKNLNKLSESAKASVQIIESRIKSTEKYSTQEFINLDTIYQNASVHKFLREKNLDYDRKKIEDIVSFINNNAHSKSGKTYSLTTDLWLFVNNKKIKTISKITTELTEVSIKTEGTYNIADNYFTITKTDNVPDKFPADCDCTAYIQIEEIDFTLRGRKDGDIIQPLGMKGSQKLKKYLNEKKIPKHEKDKLIFLCKDKEILWAAGLGLSEKIKVVTKPTHVIRLEKR